MTRPPFGTTLSRRDALGLSAAAITGALTGCQAVRSESPGAQRSPVRWRRPLDGTPHDDPAVASGLVYASAGPSVVGLDRGTGTRKWKTDVAEATIATAADTLFVWEHGGGPDLTALGVEDHETRWRFESVNAMPTVRDGTAYVTRGGLNAVELRSGATRWTFTADGLVFLSDVTDDVAFVWATGDRTGKGSDRPKGVYAVSVGEGTERWRFTPPTPWGPTLLAGGTLAVGSDGVEDGGANVYGVDAATGAERWRYETAGVNAYPRYTTDERVFVLTWRDGGHTTVLDAETGEVDWQVRGAVPRGVGDGFTYLRRHDGEIVAADVGYGSERWTFEPAVGSGHTSSDRYPSVKFHGGTVWVVSDDTLFALDAKSGDERWRFVAPRPIGRHWSVDEEAAYVTTSERLYALGAP